MATADLTLLGAGKMGAACVERWVAAGRSVKVWNRTRERAEALQGPRVQAEANVADAVTGVPVVVSMLTDGAALRSVLLDQGAVAAMDEGSTLVDLSTVDVASSRAVAVAAARHGLGYVRGGVSGTATVIRAGTAGLLLSGPAQALEAAEPVLSDLTENRIVVGDGEQSRVVKLATNMLLAGTMELLAEAVVMAEASDVPRETMLRALDVTVIASRFVTYKAAALTSRDYSATFRTSDMKKDVTLALAQSEAVGVTTPVMDRVLEQLAAACDEGWADADFLALARLVQARSGQPVDGA